MHIKHLKLNNFRNILATQLDFGTNLNILFGKNGAGKTSFLESIYFLSLGRSFRSQYQQPLIAHQQNKFIIFSQIIDDVGTEIPIGIERSINNLGCSRIAEETINNHFQITKLMPIQLIAAKDYRLIEGSPEYRRQLLDWGVFHVEHSFLLHWQNMRKVIKQRNALLKGNISANCEQLQFWNKELAQIGVILHKLRTDYIDLFTSLFKDLITQLFGDGINITLEYYAGWDTNLSLQEVLSANFTKDLRFGCTSAGPHRADIKLKIDNRFVQDVLSRGQQKLLIYALRLAQGLLLQQHRHINCTYLIDDLPSELDRENAKTVLNILVNMGNQAFITGITHDAFEIIDKKYHRMFHVEHGAIYTFD